MFQNFDYYSVCSVFSLLNLFYFLENELKIVKKKKSPSALMINKCPGTPMQSGFLYFNFLDFYTAKGQHNMLLRAPVYST